MMNKRFSLFLQLLVFLAIYFLIDDIKNNLKQDINFILTRFFFINTILCILYYIKRVESELHFDSDEIFFVQGNTFNYFHLFWFFNVMLNLGMIINNFSKKFFIHANSYEDWVYIFSMFLSTYIHYGMHNKISYFTLFNPQSSFACIIHFLHYSNSFISFLSYLVINQLSPRSDDYQPLQKLLFYLIFCKFFVILRMPLAGDIGKICYSIVLLFEIKVKIQQIDEDIIEQQDQAQQNDEQVTNTTQNETFLPQSQFLLLVALITFSILCQSVYRVYKAWKYLDINGILNDRQAMLDDQRINALLSQNVQIRQRVKSTDGLNEIELMQLKKTKLEAIQIEPQQSHPSHTCSICFLEIENRSTIYHLQCEHIFHADCLDSWLKNKNSCPNCRQRVIQRSQLIVQNLEDSEIASNISNSVDNSHQQNLFEEIIRQQEHFANNQINQIEHQEQYTHQISMNNLEYDEEAPPRTTDNLNYSSQQEISAPN